jgi:Ulp1 family protease
MWIATVCDNHHWQALCIINPGTEYCIAMLLDSLVMDENDTPSNYEKCQRFATAFVNAVYEDDNMSNREAVMMHIGLVPKQPNYNDCGVFASLNVQNAASRVGELTSYGLLPTCHNYRDWYSVADGVNFRNTLRNHYQDLLDIHGEVVPFYGTVNNI